ncbi:hypothetical protein CcaCcLH18_12463 [Colletotrichum camelliae]|nr:hypothetical protein CcaCcLH18_12463 [Colletotrichum camelliae]
MVSGKGGDRTFSETHYQKCFDANEGNNISDLMPDGDANVNEEGTFVSLWEEIDTEDPNWLDMGDLDGVSPGFFRNATVFYRHAATIEGQRQLSRWPMVRALCDGLQHAGYRVEMDDDGDLWYDCEDADRYFDAWETQPAEDREDWLVDVCPICQNFEEYGLGHILEIEKDTKEKILAPQPELSNLQAREDLQLMGSIMVTLAGELLHGVLFPGPVYKDIVPNVVPCLPIPSSGRVSPLTIIGNGQVMQPSIGSVWLSLV